MNLRYLVGRAGYGLVCLWVLSVIVFACTQVLPGNAAMVILGDAARPEQIAELTRQLGLDRPAHEQYLRWLTAALSGDFGVSTTLNQPVAEVLAPRLVNSAALTLLTIVVAALVALPLGIYAALRRGRAADAGILAGSYLGISIPDFVLGPLLILAFALPPLRLFPSTGFVPFAESPAGWLWHLALPVATLTLVLMAHLVRQTRSGMLAVLGADYVRAARLKGLPEGLVVCRHALPGGLTTAVAVLALDVGYLMGSIIIVEEVFAYPGLGRTMIYAILNRDLPLVQATTLIVGVAYILSTFVADLAHGWLNPRIAHP